jgi:phage tail sheath gpL-like
VALPDILPALVLNPGVYSKVQSGGPQGVGTQSHRVLVMGLRLTTGTVAALTLAQITNAEQGATYHGEGSPLANTIRRFKDHNPLVECWSIGIAADAAGTAATGTVTFGSGPATKAGTLNFYIEGVRVPVGVAVGDTASVVAASYVTAVNAKVKLTVTAAAVGAVATNTARAKGAWGNSIDVRLGYYEGETTAAELGLTAIIVAMASGATDPDLADIVDVLPPDMRFDTIVVPFVDTANLTVITDEMADRAGPIRGIPGQAFGALRGDYSATQTLGDGQNSQYLTIVGGGLTPTPPWEIAGAVAGLDTTFTDLNTPRGGSVVKGVLPPKEAVAFDFNERNLLLQDGITTLILERGRYEIERLTTTYQETNGGEDLNYLDIGTGRVLNFIRRDLNSFLRAHYAQHKLAEDGTPVAPGVRLATPGRIKLKALERFEAYQSLAYVQGLAELAENMIVEIAGGPPGRVNIAVPLDVISGLFQFAIDITFDV